MLDILNLNPGSFGLDISDLSLKLVRLKKRREGFYVSAINQLRLPAGLLHKGEVIKTAVLGEYIKKLIDKTEGLGTRQVSVCLPEEKSFLRVIQMPKMSSRELKRAVRYEAENYIPFSLDKVYLDSQVITEKSDDQAHVLVVAIPRKIVDPYVKAIEIAGLIPLSMEIESQAAARALTKGKKSDQPVYLIDLGATCTGFSVFYGNYLRFSSFIPVSSENFTLAVAKKLQKNREEAEALKKIHGFQNKGKIGKAIYKALEPKVKELAEELNKHIDYYENHFTDQNFKKAKGIQRAFFYGGGAELAGLPEYLSKKLHIKVEKGNPLINLVPSSKEAFGKSNKKISAFTVAIGLALREFKHD